VALNDSIPKTVVFIVGRRMGETIPIGTGFVVGVRTPPGSSLAFTLYVVTARHVVQFERETWIRFRKMDGTLEDRPVASWELADDDEVALTVLDSDEGLDLAVLPIPDFLPTQAGDRHGARDSHFRPMLGDRVYLVGLFAPIRAMGEQNVPIVRAGTVAARNQPGIPVTNPDGTVQEHTAHLVDCRFYRGFSGSPCFVQFPREPGGWGGGVGRPDEETELFGLVMSHFDAKDQTKLGGLAEEDIEVEVPVHHGVGVVVPAEAIAALLDREDVVADREARQRNTETTAIPPENV
jgi:hypothetical protein